jgi:hypothetical protein
MICTLQVDAETLDDTKGKVAKRRGRAALSAKRPQEPGRASIRGNAWNRTEILDRLAPLKRRRVDAQRIQARREHIENLSASIPGSQPGEESFSIPPLKHAAS